MPEPARLYVTRRPVTTLATIIAGMAVVGMGVGFLSYLMSGGPL